MEAQDAAAAYFFKLWEWVENNIRTVVIGAMVVVAAAVVISYYFWKQSETEMEAGKAFTQLLVSTPPDSQASDLANSYLKLAADYPGTQAAGRALIMGATTLYVSGDYAKAQSEFQQYMTTYPAGPFAATALLGVAASLDAQHKTDDAAKAYQRVINNFSDPNATDAAKFALAKIDEQLGKLSDAADLYMEVARSNPNSPLGSEAALQAEKLRGKAQAPTTPAPATTQAITSSNRPPVSFKQSNQQ